MNPIMTVAELFNQADLKLHGPVRWKVPIPREDGGSSAGVYVVARVNEAAKDCEDCALQFKKPLPTGLGIDHQYEQSRWLSKQPILYIGKTDRTIQKRLGEFYRHECGYAGPHNGGEIVKLLKCELSVYWSPATNPYYSELTMIRAFLKEARQVPFANTDGRSDKRIQRTS